MLAYTNPKGVAVLWLVFGVACKATPDSEASPSGNAAAGSGTGPETTTDAGTVSGSTNGAENAGGGGVGGSVATSTDAGGPADADAGPDGAGAVPPSLPVMPRPPPPVGNCVEFAANFSVQCESVAPGAITEETCARDYLHYEGLGCRTSWNLFVACASFTTMDCVTMAASSCETQHAAYDSCQQDIELAMACERSVDADATCPEESPYAFNCTGAGWAGCVPSGELLCCPPPDPYAGVSDAGP